MFVTVGAPPAGQYFFELDDKAVLAGYPRRIADAWGVPGPVDAAFTRINCQGKSYIFQVSPAQPTPPSETPELHGRLA